jgi:ABC-type multidrug transport system ATPase subunit
MAKAEDSPPSRLDECEADGLRSPSVECDHLSINLGGREVINNVCFQLPGGKTIAVMGPRRSGKSVLAGSLAGRIRPSGGRILVNGESIWENASEQLVGQLKRTGVFFGANRTFDDKLDRSRSVLDNLKIPLEGLDTDGDSATAKALEWAREWDLGEVTDIIARDIDSIARHRLCLAQTMVADPPLVIVDDPSSAVDLKHIMAEIKSINRWQRRTGGTIFLTTHSIGLARGLADQIAVLREGEIIATGTAEDMLKDVRGDTTFEEKFGVALSYREADPERLKAMGTEQARARRNNSMYSDMSQRSNSGIYDEEEVRPKSSYDEDVEAQRTLGGKADGGEDRRKTRRWPWVKDHT